MKLMGILIIPISRYPFFRIFGLFEWIYGEFFIFVYKNNFYKFFYQYCRKLLISNYWQNQYAPGVNSRVMDGYNSV